MSRSDRKKPRQPRVARSASDATIAESLRKPLAPPARVETPAKRKQQRRQGRRQIESGLEDC